MAKLAIVRASAPATLQDAGRRGHMREGVPPGGALVPELLARANLAAGNAWDAPAIEAYGAITLAGDAIVAWDDGTRVEMTSRLDVPAPRETRVRYVAARGGFDAPLVLGGRGALPVAGIGRVLRAGDELPLGAWSFPGTVQEAPPLDATRAVRVVPGPDLARFADGALDALFSGEFAIAAASDRTGTRLVGAAIARAGDDRGRSAPMVRGAVQVPAGGAPIVLGPDHPTTGGYPVLAVVARVDLGALFARRPGQPVRFARVSAEEARKAWDRAWGHLSARAPRP